MPLSASPERVEHVYRGLAVSTGVAHGRVRHVGTRFEEPAYRKVPAAHIEFELARFRNAIRNARRELEILIDKLDGEANQDARDVLDMHILVLEDSQLNGPVEIAIQQDHDCAETAYYRVARGWIESFQKMKDAYFRERALDIRDVAQRVLRQLHGKPMEDDSQQDPAICIAHDLTPGETVHLDRSKVLGFAIELGARNAHTAIVARALGLPAVVRLHGICEELRNGDEVLLDGHAGLLILNPSEETLDRYRQLSEAERVREAKLLEESMEPAITVDGHRVTVGANVEFIEELPHVGACGAEGIGLFRTEFLYLEDQNAPEDVLAETYLQAAAAVAPEMVIFRTLDIGGDKLDSETHIEKESNPFLGWRGIRVSLARPEMFKRQLRAILRASAHGNAAVLYPMVCSLHEVVEANKLLEECRCELLAEGVPVAEKILVGAMIEVPSAATISDLIAPHVDYFSIGTNDLIQYTLAVDRVNERVADLYQPTHPAVLRLIKTVVEAGHRASIWTGMCGEMAGDVALTPLLLGLGLDELSAASVHVARVKHAVRRLKLADCQKLVAEVLNEANPEVIWQRSADLAFLAYPELFKD